MRDLQQDSNTVSGFSFGILSRSVFQIFYNLQRVFHSSVAFDSFTVYYRADSTVIMLKLFPIQTFCLLFHVIFHSILFLSVYFLFTPFTLRWLHSSPVRVQKDLSHHSPPTPDSASRSLRSFPPVPDNIFQKSPDTKETLL